MTSDQPVRGPVTLRAGAATADVYPELGGRLGQLDLGRGPLLRGPSPELGWAHWGCYPLLPWSNRVPGGQIAIDGFAGQVPVNWEDGSAIHGLTAEAGWVVVGEQADEIDLEVEIDVGPYCVRGRQELRLSPDRLQLRLVMTNEGARPVPAGVGIHPWFCAGRVRLPAEQRWPGEPMPTGPPVPVEGRYDLREGQVPEPMDACFGALTETAAEVGELRLSWDGPITHVVVFSGVAGWVCVEPVTMATDGFALARSGVPGHGVVWVGPGEVLAVDYRFEAMA